MGWPVVKRLKLAQAKIRPNARQGFAASGFLMVGGGFVLEGKLWVKGGAE